MTVHNVSPEKFASAKADLSTKASVSSSADGNSGLISGHGVTASYTYYPAVKVLSVDITHKPFYISEASIESSISAAFV